MWSGHETTARRPAKVVGQQLNESHVLGQNTSPTQHTYTPLNSSSYIEFSDTHMTEFIRGRQCPNHALEGLPRPHLPSAEFIVFGCYAGLEKPTF